MNDTLGILFLNHAPRPGAGCNLKLLSLIGRLDPRFHPVFATPAMLQVRENRQHEVLEARIARHAIKPGDIVLEQMNGLAFLPSLCPKDAEHKPYTLDTNAHGSAS